MDGLNEISMNFYVERVKLLQQWLNVNKQASVVIGCREKHYQDHVQLKIPSVHIEPFDYARIELFLNAYLGWKSARLVLPQLGPKEVALRAPRDLIHLADNPFFLRMICYIYVNQHCLPSSRGELFRMFVETLYDREKEKRTVETLSSEGLLKGLSAIAFAMQSKRSATSVHTIWAEKQLAKDTDTAVLWAFSIEAGLIQITRNARVFQFSHQSILEYFAAEGLLTRKLSRYVKKPNFSRNQRKSGPWDEVIYTLVGISQPNDLLAQLAQIDPFLSVDCFDHIADDSELTEDTLKLVIQRLIEFIDSRQSNQREAAIAKLIKVGNQVIPFIIRALRRSKIQVVKRAGLQVLAHFDELDATRSIALALLDDYKWVRKDAVVWINESDRKIIYRLLEQLLQQHQNNDAGAIKVIYKLCEFYNMSQAMVDGLAKEFSDDELIWGNIADLLSDSLYANVKYIISTRLKRLADCSLLSNPHPQLRIKAIRSLQHLNHKGLVGTLSPSLEDTDSQVRVLASEVWRMAVTENEEQSDFKSDDLSLQLSEQFALLGRVETGQANTLIKVLAAGGPLVVRLIKLSLCCGNEKLLRRVPRVLAKMSDSTVIPILLSLLSDQYCNVRTHAIMALKVIDYHNIEMTLSLMNDKDTFVRCAALCLLITNRRQMPAKTVVSLSDEFSKEKVVMFNWLLQSGLDNLTSVVRRYLNDNGQDVRVAAIKYLSESDYPELATIILPLLDDTGPKVRTMAIKTLLKSEYSHLHKRILPLLSDANPDVRSMVIRALLKSEYSDLHKKIVPFLSDTNPGVRTMVIRALLKSEYSDLHEKILPFLSDNNPNVRAMAIRALLESEYSDLREKILPLLSDTNQNVRAMALKAL